VVALRRQARVFRLGRVVLGDLALLGGGERSVASDAGRVKGGGGQQDDGSSGHRRTPPRFAVVAGRPLAERSGARCRTLPRVVTREPPPVSAPCPPPGRPLTPRVDPQESAPPSPRRLCSALLRSDRPRGRRAQEEIGADTPLWVLASETRTIRMLECC